MNKIKVLVVDDSPTKREILSSMINSDDNLEVISTGENGKEAVEKAKHLTPDVIAMDIKMPIMDGLEATRKIMTENPTPILIVSSVIKSEVKYTLEAMKFGAIDFIPIISDMDKMKEDLISKIKIASKIKVVRYIEPIQQKKEIKIYKKDSFSSKIIAIGVSTGGPQALMTILSKFPENLPASIIIVQHMVEGFTQGLAEWLDRECKIKVKEAKDRDIIKQGVAYICPGNFNLIVTSPQIIRLKTIPENSIYKPSIDEMMKSVAKNFLIKNIGVILTGMGKDGVEGIGEIKKSGGITLAQDHLSSVVFGMAKVAIEAGYIDKIVPLSMMADEIINLL